MKLMDIYFSLKSDIDVVERRLHDEVHTSQRNLKKASTHLLKAGGKRIRPIFVLLAGKFGNYDVDRLAKVAAALELIHMASLVHDDVIDDAALRRGNPTVKSEWGNRMAMYAGDFIFARSLVLLSELPNVQVHQLLSKSIVSMCEGEIEQIRDFYNVDQNLRTYLRRIKRKTALLLSVSTTLGAMVADCKRETVHALERFGYYAGMAFQIIDDILDLTATSKKLGKPVGNDLRQGNLTLPVLYALQHAPERDVLRANIHRDMTEAQALESISIVRASGGLEYAHRMADRYMEKCLEALELLPKIEATRQLTAIAHFINERDH
ncbi:polyprenyl synthetase family protein [Tumebacillus sp. ITR2]|uniref:Polyprenyl synthetase family protein n=1 Tax=Tumebacillus amylolyticus TaxID=2801339 RepID=A0ABS1JD51_9BACL|nr:polyprenyl synthetase family protein [Tumebacillus amylolyticus]MBL0387949.1 polyprenyl synthetase family protein [Tumebacillus amylolyticus]